MCLCQILKRNKCCPSTLSSQPLISVFTSEPLTRREKRSQVLHNVVQIKGRKGRQVGRSCWRTSTETSKSPYVSKQTEPGVFSCGTWNGCLPMSPNSVSHRRSCQQPPCPLATNKRHSPVLMTVEQQYKD